MNLTFRFFFLDPRQWTEGQVAHWLSWAAREFSLEGAAAPRPLRMRGRDMCALGREAFLALVPPFTGDILWEHLEILQKGKILLNYFVLENFYIH